MRDDLVHDVAGHIHGDGKADALISAASVRYDRGVDSDQIAVQVDQRAARVAGVNGSVSLNKVFIVLDRSAQRAPGGADDAIGGCFAHSERVSNGKNEIANLDVLGIPNWQRTQAAGFDL
jgi:hypothetical protein